MATPSDTPLFIIGDTTVTDSDRLCFSTNAWLTDNSIAFYFDYLTSLSSQSTHENEVNPVLFMNPSTAWMANMISDPAELGMCLDQIYLSRREVIFVAVNNAVDPTKVAGGSHWALLIFHRSSRQYLYIDSMRNQNKSFASTTAKNLTPVLELLPKSPAPAFEVLTSPQQQNGYDCGVYTIAAAEVVNDYLKSEGIKAPLEKEMLTKLLAAKLTPDFITQKRADIVLLIDQLSQKQ